MRKICKIGLILLLLLTGCSTKKEEIVEKKFETAKIGVEKHLKDKYGFNFNVEHIVRLHGYYEENEESTPNMEIMQYDCYTESGEYAGRAFNAEAKNIDGKISISDGYLNSVAATEVEKMFSNKLSHGEKVYSFVETSSFCEERYIEHIDLYLETMRDCNVFTHVYCLEENLELVSTIAKNIISQYEGVHHKVYIHVVEDIKDDISGLLVGKFHSDVESIFESQEGFIKTVIIE